MVGFARHGLWAGGGGLCLLVVAGCLGGFGCWFGGCLGVGLIGGCLRQWVFGWHRTILGYQGPVATLSLGFKLQRKCLVSVRVVALGSNGHAGEGNVAVLVEKNKLKEMREKSESPSSSSTSFSVQDLL